MKEVLKALGYGKLGVKHMTSHSGSIERAQEEPEERQLPQRKGKDSRQGRV